MTNKIRNEIKKELYLHSKTKHMTQEQAMQLITNIAYQHNQKNLTTEEALKQIKELLNQTK